MTEPVEHVRSLVDGSARRLLPTGRAVSRWTAWCGSKRRIAALQGVADQEWIEELRSAWWQLESVNAFWIESGRAELTEDERREVDEGLDELLPMLVEY